MAQQSSRPDPSDPGVPVAAIRDSSAFAGYRPFREQKPAPWKEIIDEVSVRPAGAEHAGHDAGGALSQPAIQAATQTPTPPAGAVAQAGVADSGIVAAVGVVREIDRANAKVKLAHEPIEVLGLPSMTMYFRLREAALADQVKVGDKVEFFLRRTTSGYVILRFQPPMADPQ